MATIYRYILETREGGGTSGRKNNQAPSKKTTGKGKWVSILNSPKGGVEHNRKMRAINPLFNRATGGYWEQGMRVGRAGLGLVKRNTETGEVKIGGVGWAIIIAWVIQTILKFQRKQIAIADKQNTQNYKSMENGVSQIHGEYQVTRNFWNGKISYNENK